jgi:hypothetical protein
MSSHLRANKECLNCGYTVDKAYCSNCGQKNTETRQPFLHLFAHFIEDLTHYDGAFWKTIKHLLFRPARLTKEYLQGKRQTYVPPVKLYIFISFVTFFTIIALSKTEDYNDFDTPTEVSHKVDDKIFNSVKELEEHQNTASKANKISYFQYLGAKISLNLEENEVGSQEILQAVFNTFSKVLFLYMPFFAFWLWLFHSKKKWYFFDHSIFTLHYFSFLLLNIAIYFTVVQTITLISESIGNHVAAWYGFILTCYMIFYFFRAHRRMYGEKRWISRLKGFILFWINLIFISLALLAGSVYALLNVH